MSKDYIRKSIQSRKDILTKASDQVWEYAETAFVEFKSVEALCQVLQQEGFAVEKGIGGIETAFKGTFGSGKPVIGFLGEYDALFGLSQDACVTQKTTGSPGRPGHGCGHNLLGVGALAAAIAIKDYLQQSGRQGTVVFFGTPGEEGGSGKAFMAREGCFDILDAALTWHPSSYNMVRTASSLANIQASFRFTGVSAHAAAAPHAGRSALDAAELMNVGVNFMREHVTSDVRVHYSITNAGGMSPNVVQPEAELLYLCRAETITDAMAVYQWVCDIARGAAMMTQTKVEIDFVKACSNVIPNSVMEAALYQNMQQMPPYSLTEEENKLMRAFSDTVAGERSNILRFGATMGKDVVECFRQHLDDDFFGFVAPMATDDKVAPSSTDVGDVSWVCPTAQISGATQAPMTPGHSWQTVAQGKSSVAHKGMLYAGEILAAAAVDLYENPDMLARAKAEHARRVGPEGYKCPIPADVKPRPIG